MLEAIARIAKGFVQAGGSVVGLRQGIEEPTYTAKQLAAGTEIRHYETRFAAETAVSGDQESALRTGFHRLAKYISGANQPATKIAMTAPVTQHLSDVRGAKIAMTAPFSRRPGAAGEWVVRFFMPANLGMKPLPQPADASVKLATVPAETLVVRRFSGRPTESAIARQMSALQQTLRENGFRASGAFEASFYDPPWTVPWLRRNEIAVPVEP